MQSDKPHAICGAKTRSGKPCQAKPMANGRCRMHGGKTPNGVNSPHFKTGAYSRYIPKGIKGDYEAALNDPKWLSLQQDIATIEGRLSQIFKAVDSKETPEFIEAAESYGQEILQALDRYKHSAVKSRDTDDQAVKMMAAAEMRQSLLAIEEAAQILVDKAQGASDVASLWKEAYAVMEQRRKAVKSEYRLKIELRQTITKERALILFGAMVEQFRLAVAKKVEPETARTIMLEVGHKVQALISAPVPSTEE